MEVSLFSITLFSWGNFFSCQKRSVANSLVVFGLFLFVFIFCQLCGLFDVSCCDFDFEGGKYNRNKTQLQNKRQTVRLGSIFFLLLKYDVSPLPFYLFLSIKNMKVCYCQFILFREPPVTFFNMSEISGLFVLETQKYF